MSRRAGPTYQRQRPGRVSPEQVSLDVGLSEATIRRRCASGDIRAKKNRLDCWEIDPAEAKRFAQLYRVVDDPALRWEQGKNGRIRPYHTPNSLALLADKPAALIRRLCREGHIDAVILPGSRPHIKIPLEAAQRFLAQAAPDEAL